MKRILALFFIALFIGVGWFISAKMDSPLKSDEQLIVADDYKCFAELYPQEAKILGLPKLGEVQIRENNKYRVMVECKHLGVLLWIQFVDMAGIDEQFDNNCDFSVYIAIKSGQPVAKQRSCMEALKDVAEYCTQNELEIDDFMHDAPKIIVKSKFTI